MFLKFKPIRPELQNSKRKLKKLNSENELYRRLHVSSKNLVICDPETDYAARLAAFLNEKKELAFQVKTCRSLKQMQALQEEMSVEVLLISGEYTKEQRQTVNASRIIVLTVKEEEDTGDGQAYVFKYQSGDEIYAQIIKICAADNAEGILNIRKKEKGKIIGIYSPVHRTGQTTFAIEKGRELSKEQNVLYLNLEAFAGFGGHFPEERNRNLSVLLYYIKQESGNPGLLLPTLVKQMGELYYIPPAAFPEDLKAVTAEEWIQLFYEILKSSIYDVLVLDLGECIQGLYRILSICDTVYLPEADDEFAAAKIKQYEETLWQLGYGEVWERMKTCDIRRTAPGANSGTAGFIQRSRR